MSAKRLVALIHASRASVEPVTRYYLKHAPEFDYVNLLDDGAMKVLDAADQSTAFRRLGAMVQTAQREYNASAALLVCSALRRETLESLRAAYPCPMVKIDEPMAREAVAAGHRIGLLASFPPTMPATRRLLQEAARDAGKEIELIESMVPEALHALLNGNPSAHDDLLLAAIEQVLTEGPDAVVLAQVSMARVRPLVHASVPVFTSLDTSLAEIRRVLQKL